MSEGWAQHYKDEPDELRKADFGNNTASDHSMSHVQCKVDDLKNWGVGGGMDVLFFSKRGKFWKGFERVNNTSENHYIAKHL